MKRLIGSLLVVCAGALAFAQAPFTIVRPADGARVRETVHVLIPKGSIPDGGYVGVFLGGKFLEATVPPLKGKYYDYALDTKALKLPDTEPGKPLKLELVLYVDYNEKSRIVDRTSVDVNIGNQANIPLPNDGIRLRYTFVPGTKLVYNLEQKISVSPLSAEENSLGGRAAEFTADAESVRLAYEVMNSYGDGDGLLRMQPLPEKGKDYALFTVGEQPETKFFDYEMAPIYMRIHSTGQEVFGSFPRYVPMEGSQGQGNYTDLVAPYPLPTLPSRPVHVGDSWQSQFQEATVDLENRYDIDSFVTDFPARGEFVDTEWEGGHPCAKLRHTIEAGTATKEGKKLKAAGAAFSDDKVSLDETIWFALDTHQVLKVIRDVTIDRKVQNGGQGGGMNGLPGFNGPGGPMGPGGSGMPPGAGRGGQNSGEIIIPSFQKGFGGQRPPGMPPGAGFGPPGGPGGQGRGRGMFGNQGPAQQAAATFIRLRILQTFTLEGN